MRRCWICILIAALLITLSADVASAKKSRSSRAASRGHVKRETRGSRTKRSLSRRESSRRDKRARGKLARRGKHSRYVARSRHSRGRSYEPQPRVADSSSPHASPGIPSERVTEIQKALIKAGYLDGPASGQYDDATIQAMKQFQADNGLSQTGLPSAPLLKKLGVPKRSNDGYAVPVNSVSENEKKRPQ